MKKSLALLFLSFTIACSAWAEKYEYVRLKGKTEGVEQTRYDGTKIYLHDSFSLETGDYAENISWSDRENSNSGKIYVKYSNEIIYEYSTYENIAGPCTVFLGTWDQSRDLTSQLVIFEISRASDRIEKIEFVHLISDGESKDSINFNNTSLPVYDSFTLGSGDTAEHISDFGGEYSYRNSPIYLETNDGEIFQFREITTTYGDKIVGPGTVYLGSTPSVYSFAIQRASDSGSTTLAWNGTEWEGSSDGSQQANNDSSGGIDPTSIKYDELLGWAWFTDTPWVYSYTNLSWYYMHPTTEGFYVWNANLPDNGWMLLERG